MVPSLPRSELSLPVIANDWCTSWGDPRPEVLEGLADRLSGTPVSTLVIDAGWYREEGRGWWAAQGDWQVSPRNFPKGLKATADAIRARGLTPGLWFEFEVVGNQSAAWNDHAGLCLPRDGRPVQAGCRCFLDFRRPELHARLERLNIDQLAAGGFGYLKIDYNDDIGLGAEGGDSVGEALRAHGEGVQRFWARLRERLPELVIEACASGGHRLEPSFLALASMGSFSDAHEVPEIPVISAQLQRLVLPRQCQVWAVLRREDTSRRLLYSLSAGFLGRLCLSGDLAQLDASQWSTVRRALDLYVAASPVIAEGRSRLVDRSSASRRHLAGWQGVVRTATDGHQALVVVHQFSAGDERAVQLQLEGSGWRIVDWLGLPGEAPRVEGALLTVPLQGAMSGQVVRLVRA